MKRTVIVWDEKLVCRGVHLIGQLAREADWELKRGNLCRAFTVLGKIASLAQNLSVPFDSHTQKK